ncbi:hypothetical protein AWW67_02520 [Roseivirga seohaensis]|uniref:Oligosaccharide repeat unit polymerase n=1 Tax=Roseivirga seohaensis TaxID=1914963 RepID=A0A150XZ04_9BACT|nr:hypothetical protein [Roseivirga seohaensis]KYG84009.1 hypothetical protein AWW67_02520 [Roseivirga seohaensis]
MFDPQIYSYSKLLAVLIPYVLLFFTTIFIIRGSTLRLLFVMFFGGFFFYSGLGYGFKFGLADNYQHYFLIFATVFCLSIVIFNRIISLKELDFTYVNNRLESIFDNRYLINFIIVGYLSSFVLDLITPEFKLGNLISPPRPNLLADFQGRFDGTESTTFLNSIFKYFRSLIYPFYMVVLIKQIKRIPLFVLLLFAPLYLEYCSKAYIGRSAILLSLIFLFMMLWKFRPEIRRRILIITLVVFPSFVVFSFVYQVIRNPNSKGFNEDLNVTVAAEILINTEVSLPTSSSRIVDQDERVNLKDHLTWMFTASIPKFGLFELKKGLAGYEIAEIIVGKKRSTPGFWVPLTGYLTENIYVYGKLFFWFPAIIIAFLLCFIGKCFGEIPLLYGFVLFLGLTFAYNLNRAGIGSSLPLLVTYNMIMFLFLFLVFRKVNFKWKLHGA